MKAAFTLTELLVVMAILAVLAAVVIPATSRISQFTARTKSISNMRQIGVAAHLYANDHRQQIPGQPGQQILGQLDPDGPADRWPKLFCEYLSPSDPHVFLDPTDASTAKLPLVEAISNSVNNTGYVYNGFDDLATDQTPLANIPLVRLETPSQVVLLAQKTPAAKLFYVDPLLGAVTDLLNLLNPQAYDGGAYYLYVDGSVRFLKQTEYTNKCWLVDKTINLPLPLPFMTGLRVAVK